MSASASSGQKKSVVPLAVSVLTISDSRTEETDTSGKLLVDRLREAGHKLSEKRIVADNIYQIRAIVAAWCASEEVQVVILHGRYRTDGPRRARPSAVRPLLDKEIEGFGEVFRVLSYEEIGGATIQFPRPGRGCATPPLYSVFLVHREHAPRHGTA